MRSLCRLILAVASFTAVHASLASEPAPETPAPPAKLLILGSFHFSNPGLDLVKTRIIDVMQPTSQQYLEQLAQRLAGFKPTAVLLEYSPESNDKINARYRDYLAGRYTLGSNEMYQIGFRVARLAGLKEVRGFDEQNTPWDGRVFEAMATAAPETRQRFEQTIAQLSADERTLGVRPYILHHAP